MIKRIICFLAGIILCATATSHILRICEMGMDAAHPITVVFYSIELLIGAVITLTSILKDDISF